MDAESSCRSKPFRLLIILLENPGQVVTREQIQGRIWDANTFVDFDSSLRVAVRKLRDALGDDAENPRYIETIPRRGYRFIASASRVEKALSPEGLPSPDPTQAPEERMAAPQGLKPAARWKIAIAICTVVAVGAIALLWPRHRHVLSGKDTAVLASFTNTTGDPVFDETLHRGIAIQLEQSPYLSLISDQRVAQVLHLMGKGPNLRLDPQTAREVCRRTGSSAVLYGSIASLGSKYVLGLRAEDCRTGKVLADEQVQADRKEEVLNALDQVASKFRSRVGESLTTVEKYNTPLADATTPSLEALEAYSAGLKYQSERGSAAALPLFDRAIALDPNFAMAYGVRGHLYGEIGESDLAAESISKAYRLQARVSEPEKYFLSASYDFRVTGNLEKAEQTCLAWAEAYPRDNIPHGFLGGVIYPVFGKYEEARKEAVRAIELDPDFAISYSDLAYNYVYLDRSQQAEETLRAAAARGLEASDVLVLPYVIAFLKDDQAGMEHSADLEQSKSESEAQSWYYQAYVMAYTGRLQQARILSRRAIDLARQSGQLERAALWESGAAVLEAFLNDPQAARQRANDALNVSKDREVEYGAALALALSGDRVRAETLVRDLEKRFPEDTSVNFNYLPTLRASLALKGGNAAKAIEALQIAAPYDLGAPRSSYHGIFGPLYPVFFRGQALLAAHQGPQAAAEFEAILHHRGIVVSDPIGALARLQLARALVLSGDRAGAKAAYQDFLALWKAADPAMPLLRRAKEEYARLQ